MDSTEVGVNTTGYGILPMQQKNPETSMLQMWPLSLQKRVVVIDSRQLKAPLPDFRARVSSEMVVGTRKR